VANFRKPLGIALVSAAFIAALAYGAISALQRADAATIATARQVDAFIIEYCKSKNSLPISNVLQSRFPGLNRESRWFFYTDDKTYLIVQYPVRWSNKDAIGRQKTSEFTGTVYAYTIDYRCNKGR